jgi:cyclohexyl-isocyanide hydratase
MSGPVIVFGLFPGVRQLDFTGPHEVFAALPDAAVIMASAAGGMIEAAGGMTFAGLNRLADIPACNVLCVPGGRGTTDNAGDEAFLGELRRLAATARFVTSVCAGAPLLGAAGLLRGKRAATHWAWRELLVPFGAIPDSRRVVGDGNATTGGGVTAGIDFALSVVAELAWPETAHAIQLQIEYEQQPPFDARVPETAPPAIMARVRERISAMAAKREQGGRGCGGPPGNELSAALTRFRNELAAD